MDNAMPTITSLLKWNGASASVLISLLTFSLLASLGGSLLSLLASVNSFLRLLTPPIRYSQTYLWAPLGNDCKRGRGQKHSGVGARDGPWSKGGARGKLQVQQGWGGGNQDPPQPMPTQSSYLPGSSPFSSSLSALSCPSSCSSRTGSLPALWGVWWEREERRLMWLLL